jgi:hypothetical protein
LGKSGWVRILPLDACVFFVERKEEKKKKIKKRFFIYFDHCFLWHCGWLSRSGRTGAAQQGMTIVRVSMLRHRLRREKKEKKEKNELEDGSARP